MRKIDKKDLEEILENSKKENRKYLNRILSIKTISVFDIAYIMSNLRLTDKKIKLIEYSISQYSKYIEKCADESISEYIFDVIKNIEKMEKSSDELLNELMECRNEIYGFKAILDYIVKKHLDFINAKNTWQDFIFSTIYIDK